MAVDWGPRAIIVGVGAVVWNERTEVLLVRRSNPPWQNEWSLPGGRVEFGETLRAALVREVREETGLAIEIVGLIDVAELVLDEAAGAAGNLLLIAPEISRAIGSACSASSYTFCSPVLSGSPTAIWTRVTWAGSGAGRNCGRSSHSHPGRGKARAISRSRARRISTVTVFSRIQDLSLGVG